MASQDYVILIGQTNFSTGNVVVLASSKSAGAPPVPQFTPIGEALSFLSDQGFIVSHSESSFNGPQYSLVRSNDKRSREYYLSRIGQSITVVTEAGSVSGILTAVGTDYIELVDYDGSINLVPLDSILA